MYICLAKFVALVFQVVPNFVGLLKCLIIFLSDIQIYNCLEALFSSVFCQFISQRQRPVRGSTSKLLLDYVRRFPCKSSLTAAGCYLCPAPGSKGTKMVVCCSVDCPLPSKMELTCMSFEGEQRQYVSSELKKIIANAISYSDCFVADASNLYFLESTSESVITEAKRVNIISESTYRNILLLRRNEIKHFKGKNKDDVDCESKNMVQSIIACSNELLRPGQICYFMNRFLVTWKPGTGVPEKTYCDGNVGGESWHHYSSSCKVNHDIDAEVRPMIESDWLYLAKLLKCLYLDDLHQQRIYEACGMEQITEKRSQYLDYLRFSAERSLATLKSIPVAARKSLPVLVNRLGQLLSIPSIGFKICPCLAVSCVFKPRVPLGGGYSSFM